LNTYDVAIIGAGVSGAFATYKISKEYKDVKTIIFDIGRPPMKRRRQLEGWLGCLPNSDGKLYLSDVEKVSNLIGLRKSKSSLTYFNHIIENIGNFKTIKDKGPQVSVQKKILKNGHQILLNDYIQIYPKDIHALSKYIADSLEKNENINFEFDSEVKSIYKQKNLFIINAEDKEFRAKKVIIAAGRGGWRWAHNIFKNFGLIQNNDYAKFGIKIESNSFAMKDFNKSTCTIKGNDFELGPIMWGGTIIPEDHIDMATTAFRSNENRWKTDKVSFSLIGDVHFPNEGFEQTDRIAKLTFLLANDRILKEKISTLINNKSKISIIPEYNFLKKILEDLSSFMPDIISKGHFHVPTITTHISKINIKQNLETDLEGLFVVGESAGINGILSAVLSGLSCIDFIFK